VKDENLTAGEVPRSPAVEDENELPHITEEIAKTLSPEVHSLNSDD
jgi:hypothetical protein